MTADRYFKDLQATKGKIDVILDTDAFNEIDDQFAIAYMLANKDRFNIKGICAAPFLNSLSVSAEDGMKQSYDEILHLLTLAEKDEMKAHVYRGSAEFLRDENTPTESDAADFMARLANQYSPEAPLCIVAIGAITNVASAILKNPDMTKSCVIVWLGGHATHIPRAACEFNMKQDIAAARIVLGCGVPLVLLPCNGVVDIFRVSKYELEHFLLGRNKLCDYLCKNAVTAMGEAAAALPRTRVIWDVTAVAWLLNDGERFMRDTLIPAPIPEYDESYTSSSERHLIKYVYHIDRDALFEDLFRKLAEFK